MPSEITTQRLRALAGTHTPEGKVLSLFIDLDPHAFPTPAARATEIRAMLDEAARRVREHDALTPAERVALDADIGRTREELSNGAAGGEFAGARGLAIFASRPAGLFELIALPRAVSPEVRIADRPALKQIAQLASTRRAWIALVDRRRARILSGTIAGLVEHLRIEDAVAGRHDQSPSHARDQGGTSHERHQRSADKDVLDHLRGVAAELRRLTGDDAGADVVLGGPPEAVAQFRELLGSEPVRPVPGAVDVDVWISTPAQVLAAARPLLERLERERDEALLTAIGDAIGTGRGAAGLGQVLDALGEHKVARLAVASGTEARGVRCERCGWLGLSAGGACPVDGTVTTAVEDIVEEAVARALAQGAEVHVLAADAPLPAAHGGIAAALRF